MLEEESGVTVRVGSELVAEPVMSGRVTVSVPVWTATWELTLPEELMGNVWLPSFVKKAVLRGKPTDWGTEEAG